MKKNKQRITCEKIEEDNVLKMKAYIKDEKMYIMYKDNNKYE